MEGDYGELTGFCASGEHRRCDGWSDDDWCPCECHKQDEQEPDGTDPNDIWQDVYSEPQE